MRHIIRRFIRQVSHLTLSLLPHILLYTLFEKKRRDTSRRIASTGLECRTRYCRGRSFVFRLFVLWENLFCLQQRFLPHSIKMLKIFPLTHRTLGVFLTCRVAEEMMLIWNILYLCGKIHVHKNTNNTHTTPSLSTDAFSWTSACNVKH